MHTSIHSYGTRIRNHAPPKPSTRFKQGPPSPHSAPRRIKPVPIPAPPPQQGPALPVFPLPGVMLHPDDASNKVFHAIGRSFLSVENRAMTIKDLAEMTLKYGLMCQNVSAASQAITTYIRNHIARCEAQQDHPLLLRHVLSGTLADDDLVPALYSRTGGATNLSKSISKDLTAQNFVQTLDGERLTNFRRGTMVWYLSKVTGISCPFTRAGIRLCEYGKEGRTTTETHGDELQSEHKRHTTRDEAQCGEKRKRLRRGCRRDSDGSRASLSAGWESQSSAIDSGYGELSSDSSDDERPPKVKLTLRLRPSLLCGPTPGPASQPREIIDLSHDPTNSSEDDAGADGGDDADMHSDPSEAPWSLPPYPRRAISVPCYTPSSDEHAHSAWPSNQRPVVMEERKRSPSVPWSASPPPDSDRDDAEFDNDSDVDWNSSSLSIPSPVPIHQAKVETTGDLPFKDAPADIRDMLDAWEDFDCAPTSTVSSATVKLPTTDELKFNALELWEWQFESSWTGTSEDQQDLPVLKAELDVHEFLLTPDYPFSPCSPFTSSSHHSSLSPKSESGITLQSSSSLLAESASPFPPSSPNANNRWNCALTWQDAELLGPDSVHPRDFEDGWASGGRIHSGGNLLLQRASDEATHSPCVEPKQDERDIKCTAVKKTLTHTESRTCPLYSSSGVVAPDRVVVRTCHPCNPDVCATQIEGISVYQTMLGPTLLLRRIDTDFVNLSAILSHLSASPSFPLPSTCVNVSHPSLSIGGIWAPLHVARLYARGLPLGIESIFLSDDLVMRFPTALQDFYQRSTSWRLLDQFGPNFDASLCLPALPIPSLDQTKSAEDVWEGPIEPEVVEEPLLAIPPSVNLALAKLHPSRSTEVVASTEAPLSPTEQEIFHALCIHPDWEMEEASHGGKAGGAPKRSTLGDQPLRRSRRVANAIAARSRVGSPRARGPRHT